jgi:hypothetical protein
VVRHLKRWQLFWDCRNELIEFAKFAQKKQMPISGVVDRMILLASKRTHSILFTSDKKLLKLALFNELSVFC